MSTFKCKMCGGDLDITAGVTVCECEYCGSKQTVPAADNEKKMTLFGRANRLLRGCEFDKAAGIFESIVVDFPEEAEAYWGLVLCKYGIEYVDDPATARKVPTCHRSSFESVMDDANFDQACENADSVARRVYRDEAKTIEELRKGIIEVSGKEAPYDIFICYKETAENGERTLDSVMAQDVYDVLSEKGYRVFFSRVTLEDKLGQEYEPYIFAALNSAKIMLAFGTDYDYYNAVWVKNEWSRFLQLIAKGEKKTLIPCYKGLDAYDLPKEFAKLQAQDMGKVGAMQDLLRGIEKILPKETAAATEKNTISGGQADIAPLLKRAFMFLEDGKWQDADDYCERVLDKDPENAEAYLGKLMVELNVRTRDELKYNGRPFASSNNYTKILRFGDEALKKEIEGYNEYIIRFHDEERLNRKYNQAVQILNDATTEQQAMAGIEILEVLGNYKDSAELKSQHEECWRSRKDVALGIWAEYCSVNDKISAIKTEISQKTAPAEKMGRDIEEARDQLRDIKKKMGRVDSLEAKFKTTQQELMQANSELSSLGMFAFSKKKEISARIEELSTSSASISDEISQIKEFISSASSIETLQASIDCNRKKINECIDGTKSLNDELVALQDQLAPIFNKLEDRRIIAILLQNEEIFPSLIEDYSVATIIKANDELRYMVKNSELFCMLPKDKQKSLCGHGSLDVEMVYSQACQAMEEAKSMDDIKWAQGEFEAISFYKDSNQKIAKCVAMIANNTYSYD